MKKAPTSSPCFAGLDLAAVAGGMPSGGSASSAYGYKPRLWTQTRFNDKPQEYTYNPNYGDKDQRSYDSLKPVQQKAVDRMSVEDQYRYLDRR